MRPTPRLSVALLVPLAFAAAACSTTTQAGTPASTTAASAASDSTRRAATGTITVAAAASLTASFKTIGADFEKANPGATVTFTFDSSATLVTQIRGGAPADVFASADDANMKKLTDAGLIADAPRVAARNRLAIVVKKGNPKGIKALADLPAAGIVSLCGAEVPCGHYADRVLTRAGVTIPTDRITRGQNAKATFTAVAEGDADAGIVYVTDITGVNAEAVPLADADNETAAYPIGVIKATVNPATAHAFVAHVRSPAGQTVLNAAGFLPPA